MSKRKEPRQASAPGSGGASWSASHGKPPADPPQHAPTDAPPITPAKIPEAVARELAGMIHDRETVAGLLRQVLALEPAIARSFQALAMVTERGNLELIEQQAKVTRARIAAAASELTGVHAKLKGLTLAAHWWGVEALAGFTTAKDPEVWWQAWDRAKPVMLALIDTMEMPPTPEAMDAGKVARPLGFAELRKRHPEVLGKPGPAAVLRVLMADPDRPWSASGLAKSDDLRERLTKETATGSSVLLWFKELHAVSLVVPSGVGTGQRWRFQPQTSITETNP